jgi:hypothetical protein
MRLLNNAKRTVHTQLVTYCILYSTETYCTVYWNLLCTYCLHYVLHMYRCRVNKMRAVSLDNVSGVPVINFNKNLDHPSPLPLMCRLTQTVFHYNWLSALLSYEGRLRGSGSNIVFVILATIMYCKWGHCILYMKAQVEALHGKSTYEIIFIV